MVPSTPLFYGCELLGGPPKRHVIGPPDVRGGSPTHSSLRFVLKKEYGLEITASSLSFPAVKGFNKYSLSTVLWAHPEALKLMRAP